MDLGLEGRVPRQGRRRPGGRAGAGLRRPSGTGAPQAGTPGTPVRTTRDHRPDPAHQRDSQAEELSNLY